MANCYYLGAGIWLFGEYGSHDVKLDFSDCSLPEADAKILGDLLKARFLLEPLTEETIVAMQKFVSTYEHRVKERGDSGKYDITVTVDSKARRGKPHVCPVCGGRGVVPSGFYTGYYQPSVTCITMGETCRTCGGDGIVWNECI